MNATKYKPLIEVFISSKNIIGNLNKYKKNYPKLIFAPVLKSNAYGHGLVEVAKILDKEEKPFFVVDSFFEAKSLKDNGIRTEILIIGYVSPENISKNRIKNVIFTVIGLEQLKKISKTLSEKTKIHLKIDTGMHRQGILPDQIEEAVRIIKKSPNIKLEGVISHLADARNPDEAFTKKQIREWNKTIKIFKEKFDDIKYFHLSATAGIKYSKKIEANVARLGIGLYGGINEKTSLDLKPALKMKTVMSSTKTIPKGEYVGYDITYKTKKETKVATVPAGYFEGIDRRLSNRGFFKIRNTFCPIIGQASMNITSIDISSIPEVREGTEVILISDNNTDKNSVSNIAKITGTIAYEIFVHIPKHLKRVVVY